MNKITNLMIVDDNSRARQALTAYLSIQAGARIVAQASNGLEAIRLIAGQVPDIILMDLQMPGMDGVEATRIIKKRWPNVKVIILTIHPDREPLAMLAGADAFLIKGCPGQEMVSTILGLTNKDIAASPRL